MDEYAKKLLEKIKNKEDLDYDDCQLLERSLYMVSVWNTVLNVQLGFEKNTIGLHYVDDR